MKKNKDWNQLLKLIFIQDKKKTRIRKRKVMNTPLHRKQDGIR